MKYPKKMLIIAGSDSCGGAGVQADINISRLCGIFPLTVISCLTAQSPSGLSAIEPASESIFVAQLESILKCGRIDAVKIGMIPTEKLMKQVIGFLRMGNFHNVVVDPIMAPTAGGEIMPEPLWHNPILFLEAAPYITLLTPNLPEAIEIARTLRQHLNLSSSDFYISFGSDLLNKAPESLTDEEIAELGRFILRNSGLRAILIKGGHGIAGDADYVRDILIDSCSDSTFVYPNPRVNTINTHGTGCNLSSAIASYLAGNLPLDVAVGNAEVLMNRILMTNKDVVFAKRVSPAIGKYAPPAAIINPATPDLDF
ncbi:MAG: hydroxymethylpyrimidine/phosphomethylpyrimidine kinase [Muribaculaceae bacterium]|nr:hydroxymethylpyrimidine/phosphomethylpyrimidine kinase [Muribaculaceae bacterium]